MASPRRPLSSYERKLTPRERELARRASFAVRLVARGKAEPWQALEATVWPEKRAA